MTPELDLQSLRVLRAVAEHGTITAAARALGYSQPAVSQQLRRAEARLGTPLVTRAGRGVRLTEPGAVLARHAIAVSSAVDAALGELGELVGLRAGTVRIAAFPTASSTLVPRLLRALRDDLPGLETSYVEAEPPEAIELLADGLVDLAITFAYPGDRSDPHRAESGIETVGLFREPVVVALPASHPLAREEVVPLAELGDEDWIAGCPLCRGHLLAACEAVGVSPRIGFETDNASAVLGMVANGLGVALLPRLALAAASVPAGAVVRETRAGDRDIRMCVREGDRRVPAIAAAADRLLALDGAAWRLEPAR